YLSSMRKRFDKSPAIDAASNLHVVTMIQNHDEPYTDEEGEILRAGMARLELFTNGTAKVKKAKSLAHSVKNEFAFKDGDPLGWGRSETLVRATKEEILAYLWDTSARYVWFRPMIDTIAQRLLESVSWGLKMRLYMGAGLSTLDLLSDVYMIYTYATTGQQGTALSLAIMVGVCLLMQLLAVYLNARRGPKLTMFKEMLIVLSGTA
ncbi:hypothetical protein TeGR_g999, partial [Tetraparma gracilis]